MIRIKKMIEPGKQTVLRMRNFHSVIFNCHIFLSTTTAVIVGVIGWLCEAEVGAWDGAAVVRRVCFCRHPGLCAGWLPSLGQARGAGGECSPQSVMDGVWRINAPAPSGDWKR